MESENITDNNNDNQGAEYRPGYICSECFIMHGGHFYEQKGRRNIPNFECINMHKDDTKTTDENHENKKKNLLIHLTNMLSTFHNTKSSSAITDYPSLLFVKIALRLEHVNITKIMNQKYKLTSETATDLGKALGNVTWKVRHDVQENKTKLENPTSLMKYQN
ncbi:hypothetical protein C1645_740698 [Glomus cerebriforme]|uniref:Uncharacterized protein n=1 Tax=Glomus cerebriforme TaxID=658196 RepID=A0A397SP18_9GLOM|nr:hypothetical protein C1645_740698 [Glomus cerebriforme]